MARIKAEERIPGPEGVIVIGQTGAERLAEELSIYVDDAIGFSRDICGHTPTWQQELLLDSIARYQYTSAKSGHGTGKSFALSDGIWWYFLTRSYPIIPITAPSSHQLYDILWKEIMKTRDNIPSAITDLVEFSSTRMWMKGAKEQWFAQARTSRSDKPEALQGFHGEHLMIVAEEAGGVDDAVFETVEGALTSEDNKIVLAGNPTRTTGYFFNSHTKHKEEWNCLTFNGEESPIVSPKYLHKMARYGAHSSIYKVRVLGEFPTSEPDQLIPMDVALLSVERDTEVTRPIVWGLDIARLGGDEFVIAKRHGNKVLPLKAWRELDSNQLKNLVLREWRNTPEKDRPEIINVDEIGMGGPVLDALRARNLPVQGVNVQWRPTDVEHYYNTRAELCDAVNMELREGRLSLPDDDALIAQCASLRYEFFKGKLKILSKDDTRSKTALKLKQGQMESDSPDRFDAVMLTYYMPPESTQLDDGEDEVFKQERRDKTDYDEMEAHASL